LPVAIKLELVHKFQFPLCCPVDAYPPSQSIKIDRPLSGLGTSVKDLPESLRNSREFRRVYEHGRRYSTTYFNAFILRTDSLKPRLGLTVTRKVGNAVVRNKCKRRLREIVSRFFKDLHSVDLPGGGFDLVLNVRSSLPTAPFSEVEETFRKMMERVLRLRPVVEDADRVDRDRMDKVVVDAMIKDDGTVA
jgi:ribonuclease P protein component